MSELISVLMTAYNRERFIKEAIESVLKSDYENFELIIVDDGSTDSTVEIARQHALNDPRIKIVVNEKNLGDYPNRNYAASYASGEYIMFCDSDDMFFTDTLSYCLGAMKKFPASGLGIYCKSELTEPILVQSAHIVQEHFFKKPVLNIGPGGTIIKTTFFNSINRFPEKYGPANDMYFNIKAASATAVVLLPKLFLYYRLHEGQELNNHYSYLYNNYAYLRDVLAEVQTGLSLTQINYLVRKNNRRFSVNLIKYVIKTRQIIKARKAWALAGFSFPKFINGIFHL